MMDYARSLRSTAVLVASLLAACGDSGKKNNDNEDPCAMCRTMATRCSWPAVNRDTCIAECSSRIADAEAECQNEYDEAFACFNRETSWSCAAPEGLIGCDSELSDYDACSSGAGCSAPSADCTVCLTKYEECGWSFMERCSCQSACENAPIPSEFDCEQPNDALAACQADPINWSCDGYMTGCSEERDAYYACTAGDTSWQCAELEQSAGSWSAVVSLPHDVNGFAADPFTPGLIYAAAGDYSGNGGGVYKSVNSGLTWALASTGLPAARVESVAVSARSGVPGAVWALIAMEVYQSLDQGDTWNKTTSTIISSGFPWALVANPALADTPYLLSSEGPQRSTDQGATWAPVASGLPTAGILDRAYVQSLAIDATGTLYAGTGEYDSYGYGVFKSINHGDTWTAANIGILDASVLDVLTELPGQLLVLDHRRELYTSTDGAVSWSPVSIDNGCVNNPQSYGSQPAQIQVVADQILMLLGSGHLLRSTDNGTSWQVMTTALAELETGTLATLGVVSAPPVAAALVSVMDAGVFRLEWSE